MHGPRPTTLVALLALAGLVGAPAPSIHAAGTTITVSSVADVVADDGVCTLPEAVASANSGTASGAAAGECVAGGASTLIAFAPALSGQTINLTTTHDSAAGPSGLGVSSDITIDGSAGGITIARSSGAASIRLFYVAPTGSLTLRRLTLQGGVARGANGGGEFSTSFVGGGGGGAGLGGAIFNRGALTVEASTLTGNQAIGGDGGNSGAIPLPILPTAYFAVGGGGGGLDGVTPTAAAGGGPHGGTAGSGTGGYGGGGGGGVYNGASPAGSGGFGGGGGGSAYRDIGTEARGGGGGFGGGAGGGGANANGGLMFGGTGGFGGGDGCLSSWGGLGGGGGGLGGAIFSDAGSVNLTNSTLVGNSAQGGKGCQIGAGLGGGLFSRNASLTVQNSTVSGNITAAIGAHYWGGLVPVGFGLDSGGGIFVVGDGATATVRLNNTIIANSTVGPNQAYDYTAMTTSVAGSALSESGSDNLIELSHGFGGPPVFDPDPQLGPLQDNGGPTWTMAPAAGSPAIDAVPAPGNGAPASDQRGVARPYGAGVDIGAVELIPAPTITSAAPDSGTYGAAYSHSFTATGGPPISYSVTGGSLPPGLALDSSTGQLSGTPTQAGSFGPIIITASNGIGSATQSVAIVITPATLTITADAKTRAYSAANPTLTYTVGGLVNGDTAEMVLTGALAATATASSPPGSYAITQGSLAANANYTISFTGATLTVVADGNNTPPSGARALALGFWKNRASCANLHRGQEPVLDRTLAMAAGMTTNPPGGLVLSAQDVGSGWPNFAATYDLVLKGDTSTPDAAPDCSPAVNLLNKRTIDGKTKKANDPLFSMAAQLVGAQLNYFAGASTNGTTTINIQRAVLLLGTYAFNGLTYSPRLSASDASTATCLATQLDNYNNGRAVSTCP